MKKLIVSIFISVMFVFGVLAGPATGSEYDASVHGLYIGTFTDMPSNAEKVGTYFEDWWMSSGTGDYPYDNSEIFLYSKQNYESGVYVPESGTNPDGMTIDPQTASTFGTWTTVDTIHFLVLKAGGGTQWALYWYEGGATTGGWDTTFHLKGELSHIETYGVPLPGAVWLLGSGLLGLIAIRRRKNK